MLLAVSSIEQSYGPYMRPASGGDAAIAPASGGALLAWSESYRIRVGLLDSRARLVSAIHELPTTKEKASAMAPIAAFDGSSFLLAWNERVVDKDQTMAMFVAADGTPSGTMLPVGGPGPINGDPSLRLVWDGASYRLWNGRHAFQIARDGTVLVTSAGARPDAVTATNGVVGTTSFTSTGGGSCGGPFKFCRLYPTVTWTIGTRVGWYQVTDRPSPATIAAAGDHFAVAWTTPTLITYLIVDGALNHVAATPDITVAPGLACDETQCLLAYSQSGDVHALAFPVDRLYGPEMLTIAATERTERVPQVHLLGPDRFLVTYRSDGLDGQKLNGRIVTFDATTRRRSMR